MSFGRRTLPIRVGDVFVLSRGQRHAYLETRSLDVINIVFDPAYVGSVHPALADWMRHESLVSVGPSWKPGEMEGECLHLGSSDFALLLDKVRRMETELESQKTENRIAALAYFLLIITMLRRQSRPWESSGSIAAGHRVSRAVGFIEEHFSDPITIEDIVSHSQVSRRHFFRLFEQAIGVAPMEYLKKLRLQKAASMLLTTNVSVTQVAFACGFNDSNYFSSLYHKEFGVSPSQFKKDGQRG
jgi:AraC-like DNA-binding protein